MKRARRMGLHPRHDLSNPNSPMRGGNDQARLIENHGPRRPWECLPSQEKQKASRPIATHAALFLRGFRSCPDQQQAVERVQRRELDEDSAALR